MPAGDELTCIRCGHTWHQLSNHAPKMCVRCKSHFWNTPYKRKPKAKDGRSRKWENIDHPGESGPISIESSLGSAMQQQIDETPSGEREYGLQAGDPPRKADTVGVLDNKGYLWVQVCLPLKMFMQFEAARSEGYSKNFSTWVTEMVQAVHDLARADVMFVKGLPGSHGGLPLETSVIDPGKGDYSRVESAKPSA